MYSVAQVDFEIKNVNFLWILVLSLVLFCGQFSYSPVLVGCFGRVIVLFVSIILSGNQRFC